LVAVDKGLLTAEGVRECLQRCQHEGTHYSDSFIEQIYQAAKGRRKIMAKKGEGHEPKAELLSAEDALQDAARLREVLSRKSPERVVSIHVPLWALIEALDFLETRELKQIAQRAQERLSFLGSS
jgi:hypothetical protein